ncbi:MAG: addiction module protein [Gammaproteobacteria bacterium]
MNAELERIEAEALKLPVEDRERLIEALIESLDQADGATSGEFGGFASAEIQKSWLEEIDRRIRRIRDGQSQPVPVAEAFASIQERLKVARANRSQGTG